MTTSATSISGSRTAAQDGSPRAAVFDQERYDRYQQMPLRLREGHWVICSADKKPRTVDDRQAAATNPSTWTDFETACRAACARGFNIERVITRSCNLACVDYDPVSEASQIRNKKPVDPSKWTTPRENAAFWAFVQELDTYVEQSLNGALHAWVEVKLEKGVKHQIVEVIAYNRVVLCTGIKLIEKPIANRQEAIEELVADMERRKGSGKRQDEPISDGPQVETDEEILARARRAANAEKFVDLWEGRWERHVAEKKDKSHSVADLALIQMLAFYSPNNEQCARMFSASALYRGKKKGRSYVEDTIHTARVNQAHQKQEEEEKICNVDVSELLRKSENSARQEQRYQFKQIGDGVIDLAALHPPKMDLYTMLSSLVLVSAEKTLIAFRDRPSICVAPSSMAILLSHNTREVMNLKTGKMVVKPIFEEWQQHANKLTAYGITFDPRAGEFCKDPNQRLSLNLWRSIAHTTPTEWERRVQPFLDHVGYLVPIAEERERFLDWLAHIEQQPGELPHTHYLMVATSQGVGRGWLSAVLACVFAGHVALDFDLTQSLESGFNGHLSRKLLAVVDEVNEGGMSERWRHSEKLKSMVTTTERFINVKYGLQQSEVNCCRFLLNSNYESALPLHAGDRRWVVIRNPNEARGADYYKTLYWLLNARNKEYRAFVASVREYLGQRDISRFNPGERAPMNEAKEAVVAASMTVEDEKAVALVKNYGPDVISANNLFLAIWGIGPDAQLCLDASRKWKLLAPICAKAGIEKLKEFQWKGHAYKVWALRKPQRWKQARADELARQLNLEP